MECRISRAAWDGGGRRKLFEHLGRCAKCWRINRIVRGLVILGVDCILVSIQ